MKIVIVCDLLSTFLRFRRFLAIRLVEQGHEVTVIASHDDADNRQFFLEQAISLEIVQMDRTSLNPLSDLSYCRRLKKVIGKIQPDRILAYQSKVAVWSAVAARSIDDCHVSIMFPGLGYLFSPNPAMKQRIVQWISRRLYRYAFRSIDTAIFQNPDDVETFRSFGLLTSATKVVTVNGSGVCLDEFPYTSPSTSPMRFVMATRMLADKGIREFADVAGALVATHGDSVQFEIAGGLDTNPTAIQQTEIDRWTANGWLTHRGHLSDMVTFLKESSVFVLPSYYMEGTPRSILEAMSTGRAIITTDNRGCKETVEEGKNGFLIEQRDRASLKDAIERFINDPNLVKEMGRNSRKIAEQKYDVEVVCSQMIAAMRL